MPAAAIVGAAAVSAGGSYLASRTQAKSADRAAGLQAQAAADATAESRRQFDMARADLAPYRETGQTALSEYGALFGVGRDGLLSDDEVAAARDRFRSSPGYEFAFDEGLRALDRSASASGRLMGGGYGRELTRYGQGMASQQFDRYADRLASIAGMGQGATNASATLGAQAANTIGGQLMAGAANQGSALMQAGTARASGYAGIGRAASGAVNNYLMYDIFKNSGGINNLGER